MKNNILLAGTMVLLAAVCHAKGPGSNSANFLKSGIGARGVSMGESQTAAVNDATALYWNPGALAAINQRDVAFAHNNFVQGIDQDGLYYAHPTPRRGTLGIGLALTRFGDITGYDEFGVFTQELDASDTLVSLGWGKPLRSVPVLGTLNAGINAKYLKKELGNQSASAMMADIGFLYEAKEGMFRRLRTAFAVQNIGSGLKFVSDKSDLPRTMKLGFAMPFFGDGLVAAMDFVSPNDNKLYFNLGLDYRLWDILAFRAGHMGHADSLQGFSYGVSFGNERLHLDYAYSPFGELGETTKVSIGFKFGPVYRKTQVHTQIDEILKRAETRFAQGYLVDAYVLAAQIQVIAPWHDMSRKLMRSVEREFKEMEDVARKEQLQAQLEEHFHRGEEYFQKDEFIPARQEFEAVLALQPGHVGAKAYIERINNRFRSVVREFYENGMRNAAEGNYMRAVEFLEKALVMDPNNAEIKEQMARVVVILQQAKQAEAESEREKLAGQKRAKAMDAYKREDYETALIEFNALLKLVPEDGEALRYKYLAADILSKEAFEKGNKNAQDGHWFEAQQSYEKALHYNPQHSGARNALEGVKIKITESQKAQSEDFYTKGLEAYLLGDKDKATALWQKAIEINPNHEEAKRGLERVLKQKKENDKAQ
ncbi:MAG: PorV/PorQ family protein [Elusimicrobia bacterium]|nr:PorV/PorQ family protein [Elusimicrobiota bacterium]